MAHQKLESILKQTKRAVLPVALAATMAATATACNILPTNTVTVTETSIVPTTTTKTYTLPTTITSTYTTTATTTKTATTTVTVTVTPPGLENILSDAELTSSLTSLFKQYEGKFFNPGDTKSRDTLTTAMKSLYYKVTGMTLEQQNFTIKILPTVEYDAVSPLPGTAGTINYVDLGGGKIGIDILANGEGESAEGLFRVLSRETFNATAQKKCLILIWLISS